MSKDMLSGNCNENHSFNLTNPLPEQLFQCDDDKDSNSNFANDKCTNENNQPQDHLIPLNELQHNQVKINFDNSMILFGLSIKLKLSSNKFILAIE